MSILDKIYHEMYLKKLPEGEEYLKIREHAYAAWEKAAAILGPEFSDEVWNDLMALKIAEDRHDFKEGFCLGVQLMLEVTHLGSSPRVIR